MKVKERKIVAMQKRNLFLKICYNARSQSRFETVNNADYTII